MTFLYPIAWLFAGVLPVVVVLYLRRVRRRELTVPTLLFWQRAMGEQQHRTFLGQLRQWWSLLLQLAILLLLLFALLRPEPKGVAAAGESTVLLLDTRARMQALEPDGESRFRKAVAQALVRTAAAREGASVAVLGVGPVGSPVQVISPFSHEPALLQQRLEAVKPGDASGELGPALAQARELLAARPGAQRLVLLTDGSDLPALDELEKKEGEGDPVKAEATVRVERVVVGTPRPNVAITRFAARPQLANPQAADLFLSLANYGEEAVKGSVEISCNGTLLDVKPFALEPGAKKVETFHAIPRLDGADGRFAARLELSEGADALALDNEARAVMPAIKPLRVLLVSQGNWFLEKLFAADSALRFDFLTPDGFRPEMAGSFDVVIFDQCGPGNFGELHGNALFIKSGPIPFALAGEEPEVLEMPVITEADASHPMMRLVEWGNVTLMRAGKLTTPQAEGWSFSAPLRDAEVPLVVAGTRREPGARGRDQRMAVFAFDIAETDLPLRVAFPLLMNNTLQWLSGQEQGMGTGVGAGQATFTRDALCGDLIALAPGELVWTAAEPPLAVANTAGTFQPASVGFYELRGEENAGRWVAVNAYSEAESNLLFPKPEGTAPAGAFAGLAGGRALWQCLAIAAGALLALEWWLYHRRFTE